jgi:hypothetical protein
MNSQRSRIRLAAVAALAVPALAGTASNIATNKPGKLIKIPGGAGLIMITRVA